MALLEFVGLFTFSMAATGINKGGIFLSCGVGPFVVVWWHFHVARWNFEEILQHLLVPLPSEALWWHGMCCSAASQ